MSATFCLSPKMLANLRAIRAGEPWPHLDTAVPQFAAIPPNFLVKGSPWRLTPDGAAVLAIADERDALQATADLNAAMEKMEAALVEWSSGGQHRSGSEGCIKLWYDPAIGQFCIEGEDLRTAKRDRLVSAVLWWANPRKKPERAPEHKGLSERCILAEERVVALERERDALRKRVADFERLLTEPRVEQARLLALRDLAAGLYGDAASHTTLEARQDEILSAFLDVVDEALAANLHRRLNKGVAGALGLLEMQKDPETGESYLPSWHDLPERVTALVQEGEALRGQVKALTDERAALLAPVEGAGDDLDALVDMTCEDPKHDDLWCPTCEEYPRIRALAREVIRLRAALRLADEQSAEAIERVSSEVVAEKWNSTAELQAEVERLRTQFQETRLTLLAEQGKPEGAPPGWSYKPGDPDFDEPGEWVHKKLRLKVWKSGTGWVWGRKERSGVFVGPSEQEDGQPARVVMLAATAAVK